MNPQLMWMVIAGISALAIVAFYLIQRRRTEALRHRFGPEYERTVREVGDIRKAEGRLEARATSSVFRRTVSGKSRRGGRFFCQVTNWTTKAILLSCSCGCAAGSIGAEAEWYWRR